MPVHRGESEEGKPYYQWGHHGKKYTYKRDDSRSRTRAKQLAERQGRAAYSHGYQGSGFINGLGCGCATCGGGKHCKRCSKGGTMEDDFRNGVLSLAPLGPTGQRSHMGLEEIQKLRDNIFQMHGTYDIENENVIQEIVRYFYGFNGDILFNKARDHHYYLSKLAKKGEQIPSLFSIVHDAVMNYNQANQMHTMATLQGVGLVGSHHIYVGGYSFNDFLGTLGNVVNIGSKILPFIL
ncbi:hypothetical protein [Clostridium sp.]|uniref:hypothetical protein n=1 Tax=Clostridium sp. TaxID=1506 RepID=UPI00284C48D0|nr:hypothetical protein [Clostridium sp.]MDR3598173.1 hypothetical protein [Clostridium sp.]